MNEGDIALAPLPQADGQIKNRPVVLLRRLPPFGDFLVCGVSTQRQPRVADFDESLNREIREPREEVLEFAYFAWCAVEESRPAGVGVLLWPRPPQF